MDRSATSWKRIPMECVVIDRQASTPIGQCLVHAQRAICRSEDSGGSEPSALELSAYTVGLLHEVPISGAKQLTAAVWPHCEGLS